MVVVVLEKEEEQEEGHEKGEGGEGGGELQRWRRVLVLQYTDL